MRKGYAGWSLYIGHLLVFGSMNEAQKVCPYSSNLIVKIDKSELLLFATVSKIYVSQILGNLPYRVRFPNVLSGNRS